MLTINALEPNDPVNALVDADDCENYFQQNDKFKMMMLLVMIVD